MGGEVDSVMHPHPFPASMREVDRRLKNSAKGNEAAKSKTTNYGKCGGKCGGEDSVSPVWKRASSIYRSGRCNSEAEPMQVVGKRLTGKVDHRGPVQTVNVMNTTFHPRLQRASRKRSFVKLRLSDIRLMNRRKMTLPTRVICALRRTKKPHVH